MKSVFKKTLKKYGFSEMPGSTQCFWRKSGEVFSLVRLRSSGKRDGSYLIDLCTSVIDEFMPGQNKLVIATNHLLNRHEAVYYTWGRHEVWAGGDEDYLIDALENIAIPHLEQWSEWNALRDFLVRGHKVGHPADVVVQKPRSFLESIFSRDINIAKPASKGVPIFGYVLGILCDSIGDREMALNYLQEYRLSLSVPMMEDVAKAVDRRIARLSHKE